MGVLLFISSMNLYTFKTGGFRWNCANVLGVSGDSYSEQGAKAFRTAAEKKDILICAVSYDPSEEMAKFDGANVNSHFVLCSCVGLPGATR